ncbi:MAG TPA: hypothetical protein VGN04_10905 [Herbaspirillum sp.]|jgi:uncharacterized membrane protein
MANELVVDAPPYAPPDPSQKNLVRWLYVFHGLCLLFSLGTLSFIPLIVNYVKRDDAAGTFVATHHSWQIRSFWWYWGWLVIAIFLFLSAFTTSVAMISAKSLIFFPVAAFIWCFAWIWKAYRLIKGLIYLNENRPMPGGPV